MVLDCWWFTHWFWCCLGCWAVGQSLLHFGRGATPDHIRYAKAGFSGPEAAAVKKYDSNFIFLEPRPEYIIDNINNGLYR